MRYFLANLSILSTDIRKLEQTDSSQKTAADGADGAKKRDKLIDMDKLFDITELNIDGKIEKMDDDTFRNYVKLLDTFTETFPKQEENVKEAIKAKDNDALSKHLTNIHNILENMFAEEMAKECKQQIDLIGKAKPEKIEAYMRYYLASLSMLSLDLQMALHKTNKSGATQNNVADNVKMDKRILAVDDTSFFLVILKKNLQNTRYKINCVTSGRDALKYLEKHRADLFLLDIEMPGMNGFELAAKIREKGHKEPIFFLTGNAKKEYFAMAMKAGATDFIIKPIKRDVLITKIRKYL